MQKLLIVRRLDIENEDLALLMKKVVNSKSRPQQKFSLLTTFQDRILKKKKNEGKDIYITYN